MKIKTLFLILVSLSIFWGCAQNKATNDDSAVKLLKEFYVNYLDFYENVTADNYLKHREIMEEYCTQNFIKWYEEVSPLGHDPFLNTQDNKSETFIITKNNDVKNRYNVTLYDHYFKEKTTIKLLLVKEERGYKIDSILNPYGQEWISY